MNTHMSKTDGRGRTWRSAEVRQKLVGEFYEAGCSVASFCEERGINAGTFYSWLAKDRQRAVAPSFQEVQVAIPSAGREVRVVLPNRVEVAVPVGSSAELALVLQEAARC